MGGGASRWRSRSRSALSRRRNSSRARLCSRCMRSRCSRASWRFASSPRDLPDSVLGRSRSLSDPRSRRSGEPLPDLLSPRLPSSRAASRSRLLPPSASSLPLPRSSRPRPPSSRALFCSRWRALSRSLARSGSPSSSRSREMRFLPETWSLRTSSGGLNGGPPGPGPPRNGGNPGGGPPGGPRIGPFGPKFGGGPRQPGGGPALGGGPGGPLGGPPGGPGGGPEEAALRLRLESLLRLREEDAGGLWVEVGGFWVVNSTKMGLLCTRRPCRPSLAASALLWLWKSASTNPLNFPLRLSAKSFNLSTVPYSASIASISASVVHQGKSLIQICF
mmetsp:Transcript_3409/g.11981  ORF Transcript_3409/g.11981 Transcript_3409/m.11981 type:complete len:333 (-) Transcript_3409:367-1365(-)